MAEFTENTLDEQGIFDIAEQEFAETRDNIEKISEIMTVYTTFVMVTKGSGKVHKPGMDPGVYPAVPKCNSQGQDWSELILDEHWGDYQLCSRCFGKESGCEKLCEFELVRRKKYFRCGRRCERRGRHGGVEDDEKMKRHLCALHAEEEGLSE